MQSLKNCVLEFWNYTKKKVYEFIFYNTTCCINLVYNYQTMKNNKRRNEWGKGWDGKSRIPDKTYRENFDQIDWSSVKTKEEKKK